MRNIIRNMTTRWWDYVTEVGGTNATEIARRVGVNSSAVSRGWRDQGVAPKIPTLVRFSDAYGRPLLEVLVAAGVLTEEQARVKVVRADLTRIPSDDLLAEVGRRMGASRRSDPGTTPDKPE